MELILIMVLSLVVLPLVALTSGVVRIILGLALILFFPGYTLLAALFPKRGNLDGIERLALSFGLSLAVVPLIGLALNYTPWGLGLYPVVVSVLLFIFVMASVAWYRRWRILPEERFEPQLLPRFSALSLWWGNQSWWDKVVVIVPVLAVAGTMGTLAYLVATPRVGQEFTEFYMLGPGGKTENYPQQLVVGEEAKVILGIVNRRQKTTEYGVGITLDGDKEGEIGPITLEPEEKWEREVSFVLKKAGENQKLEFSLFREGQAEVYQTIHMQVNVAE